MFSEPILTEKTAGIYTPAVDFPALNRFIVNKRAYARKEIAIGMVVLRPGDDKTMSKIYLQPEDTIFDVERRIREYVDNSRNVEKQNSTDKLIATLVNIPGLLRFAVNVLKWMDWHNLLPKAIIDASPMHNTMVFTNLASIRTNHIHHHIYDFGTTSLLMAAGNAREIPRRKNDGGNGDYSSVLVSVDSVASASGAGFFLVKNRIAATTMPTNTTPTAITAISIPLSLRPLLAFTAPSPF